MVSPTALVKVTDVVPTLTVAALISALFSAWMVTRLLELNYVFSNYFNRIVPVPV
jgi:hypothetical protein